MRKVTKLVTFLMTFIMLIAPGLPVFAGSINEYEAALIEIGNGVFTYNGVDYVATEAAKQRVVNYLMQNDVNLSASQAEEAKAEFWGNLAKGISDGYLVRLNPDTEDTSGGGNSSNSGSIADGEDTSDDAKSEELLEITADSYTYKAIVATMRVKQNVNVRNLPSTAGTRVGSLATDQEVTIVGQCVETGWYCIWYNDELAYVSNNYLIEAETEEVPEETEVSEVEQESQMQESEQTTEGMEDNTTAEFEESTEAKPEIETEVVLREKNFNKGMNVTTIAVIVGAVVLIAGVVAVVSHKNRRYRK